MPDRRNEIVGLFVRDLDKIELPPRDRWRPAHRKESYLMKTSRYVLYAGGVAAVLIAALIVGFGLRDRNSQATASPSPIPATSTPAPASSPPTTPSPTATSSPAPTPSPSPTALSPVGGTITGRVGYPSDFVPPVTVYAISTTDSRVWYSVDFAGYGNPPRPTLPPGAAEATYTLSGVAPGTYWVVAYRNDGQLPDPGYYSRVPDCLRARPSVGGQSAGPCPDVTLIPATVTAGQTLRGIDVVTWFPAPSDQPSPTVPPRPTPR